MAGLPPSSRSSSFASRDPSSSQNKNAALLGATTAFHRPTQRTETPKSYSGTNGALAAASTVGAGNKTSIVSRALTKSPLSIIGSPAKSTSDHEPSEKTSYSSLKGNALSQAVLKQDRLAASKAASLQAAALATARAPAPSISSALPKEQFHAPTKTALKRSSVVPKRRRLSAQHKRVHSSSQRRRDSTSRSPTNSFVNILEQTLKSVASTPDKTYDPIIVRPSERLAVTSPKPVKPAEGITSVFHMEFDDDVRDEILTRAEEENGRDSSQDPEQSENSLSDESFIYAIEDGDLQSSPIPVPGRNSQTKHLLSILPPRPMTAGGQKWSKSTPSPHQGSRTTNSPTQIQSASLGSTLQSGSFPLSTQSLKTISGQFNQLYPRKTTPWMTGDELANAMVASSLASSRAPSPTRLEPPQTSSRKKKKKGQYSKLPFSRTPSPAKTGLLQTLRTQQESSSDSEDEHHPYGKHRKKRLVRKHPNKHHEGDRKRWRDAVTERERKRYEGVWAANKGVHCGLTAEEAYIFELEPNHQRTLDAKSSIAEQVSNVVVREIWGRSRLSDTVLETVWDLVDNDCVGRLHKEEFVIGLWLIDQRLKGRKLPVKVTESVWASVRGLQGIKIRKK